MTDPSAPALLCLGDSNAAGWIPALQTWLKVDVVGCFRPGMTIGFDNLGDRGLNMLASLDGYLADRVAGPAQEIGGVLVLLGTNDGKAVFAERQAESLANLESLVARLRAFAWPGGRQPWITLATPPPYGSAGDDGSRAFDGKYAGAGQRIRMLGKRIADLGARIGTGVIDLHAPLVRDIHALSSDGVHFHPAGYREIARLLAAGLPDEVVKGR